MTSEHGSFSDLWQLHSTCFNVLAILLDEEKPATANNFNYHANRLLPAFANARSLASEVEPKLAAHHAAPVRFNQAIVSSCYTRLARDVALGVVKIVEGYWREIHDGRITLTMEDPQFRFTLEHIAELARRFGESEDFRSSGGPERQWPEIRAALGETLVGLKQEAAWLDEQEAKGKPEATVDGPSNAVVSTGRKPTINARMLETMQKTPDAMGWSSPKWAKYLKCAKSTVVTTQAWKDVVMRRDREKAERVQDRRHRKRHY